MGRGKNAGPIKYCDKYCPNNQKNGQKLSAIRNGIINSYVLIGLWFM